MKNLKDIIVTATFLFVLCLFMVINIIAPDKEVSESERRALQAMPELSAKTVFNGSFMEKFDSYSVDQFVFRDNFRSIKAYFDINVMRKMDNNDIYIKDNGIYKMEYPLNEASIYQMAEKINEIKKLYLEGSNLNLYYSIIHDKNYYTASQNGYLSLDYTLLEQIMTDNINDMTYIDIKDCLNANDFYRTDTHWRQERLFVVVERFRQVMGFENKLSENDYERHSYSPFYGVLYGQLALNINPDELIYLASVYTDNCIVDNYELSGRENQVVYPIEKLGEMDSYDVFVYGAAALVTMTNPTAETGRELIVFRDSFAGSIAPLLLPGYDKITLIDTRYIGYKILDEYVEFSNPGKQTDVLFLFSTLAINKSDAFFIR